MRKFFLSSALALGFGLFSFATTANATVIFNLGGSDFSGGGANLPYDAVKMTFEQAGLNTVQLTIDTAGMPDSTGKISDIWFNIDDPFTFSDLTFTYVVPGGGVETKKILAGGNVSSAGIFDINFDYKTSGPLGDLFYDLKSVYTISGTGLLEEHFDSMSTGGYNAAMHVNITGNGTSGHYGSPVPEPATMLLLGTGLVGLAVLRRRTEKEQSLLQ